jgi:hypothetical protein
VRWGRCRAVDAPEVVGAPTGDAPRKRTGLETRTDALSKGEERKVIRAQDAATDADPATEDPIPRHAGKRPLRSARLRPYRTQPTNTGAAQAAVCRRFLPPHPSAHQIPS